MGSKFDDAHPARIVEQAVNEIDRELLRAAYRGCGSAAYPPELLLKMVLFEILEGRRSPNVWARDCQVHDALKWLGRGVQPKRTVWYDFRDRMARVIDQVNQDLVERARDESLIQPTVAAQDGTSIRSYASRHRAINLQTLLKRLALMERLQAGGPPLDRELPKWVPPTDGGREDLLERMQAARRRLNELIEENRKKPKNRRRDEDRIVVSLTDLEAPFARDKERVFCFLYTAQYLVDRDSLLVLGYSVAPENTDVDTLAPMLDRIQPLLGGKLEKILVDAGYISVLQLRDYHNRGVQAIGPVQSNSYSKPPSDQRISKEDFVWLHDKNTYRCPAGHELQYQYKERTVRHQGRASLSHVYKCPPEHCQGCPLASRCCKNPASGRTVRRLEDQHLIDQQKERMELAENKALYRERGQVVERTLADAKRHRGLTLIHGYGLQRARAEVGLVVLAQNILAIHRLRKEKKAEKPAQ